MKTAEREVVNGGHARDRHRVKHTVPDLAQASGPLDQQKRLAVRKEGQTGRMGEACGHWNHPNREASLAAEDGRLVDGGARERYRRVDDRLGVS